MMFNFSNVSSRYCQVALLSSLVALSGCSAFFGEQGVFRSRGGDYVSASPIESLTLPDGVQAVPSEQMYRIPPVQAVDEFGDAVTLDGYEVPRPLPLGDKGEVGVKIQKLGGNRWIYLNASTAQVWPRTQYFLSQYNLDVVLSNAAAGIIETDWLQFNDDEINAVRFQIKLAKGIHPETTEVHVLQMERTREEAKENPGVPWPTESDNEDREAWLLKELATTLAETVDNNSASLLGQNVGGELKAGFTRFENEPTLSIKLPTDRAWATLVHAANKEGYKTWESNSDLGLIYVGYSPYGEDGVGFFRRLAFWSSTEGLPETAPYDLSVLLKNLSVTDAAKARFESIDGAVFSGKKLEGAQGYFIVAHPRATELLVNIRDHRGDRLPEAIAKDFLRLLRKNLI
ncbi:outer membrane protein assembly factor BamC [Teredinibacter purpureus]|uniref:outer membrane protein assembly factor BamC n=1 Tax=Teredinibacter purpureus TaxID=2731756 RepID=UPI0005F864F2|nr:outer membrane protein assembly factor BamC [Teredinibacter purpureus]